MSKVSFTGITSSQCYIYVYVRQDMKVNQSGRGEIGGARFQVGSN